MVSTPGKGCGGGGVWRLELVQILQSDLPRRPGCAALLVGAAPGPLQLAGAGEPGVLGAGGLGTAAHAAGVEEGCLVSGGRGWGRRSCLLPPEGVGRLLAGHGDQLQWTLVLLQVCSAAARNDANSFSVLGSIECDSNGKRGGS